MKEQTTEGWIDPEQQDKSQRAQETAMTEREKRLAEIQKAWGTNPCEHQDWIATCTSCARQWLLSQLYDAERETAELKAGRIACERTSEKERQMRVDLRQQNEKQRAGLVAVGASFHIAHAIGEPPTVPLFEDCRKEPCPMIREVLK